MKKIIVVCIILIVIVSYSYNNLQDKKLFTTGRWHITYLLKNYSNLTPGISSYDFQFEENGKLMATRDKDTVYGQWLVTGSETTDDSPKTDVNLKITFTKGSGLSMLNSDWLIFKEASHTLHLKENSSDESFLIFKKDR